MCDLCMYLLCKYINALDMYMHLSTYECALTMKMLRSFLQLEGGTRAEHYSSLIK